MAQSPKPAKPALHLPKLEDSGLTSNQTQFLKPGDFVQIQESLYNILGSTRPHLIKRILKESIQPNQSRLWKDLAIFQFNHFQANQFRPEDIMIKPRRPEDISSHTGESETLLQCNSIHQIIQNQSRSYVPFLESKAINSQQLFSHQDWHDFYPYFCSKEVPKKLTYSLKPSRYKIRVKSLEESLWIQDIFQRLVLSVFLICLLLSLF